MARQVQQDLVAQPVLVVPQVKSELPVFKVILEQQARLVLVEQMALPEQQARLDLRDHSLPPHLKRLSYQTVLNRARVRVTSSSG